MRTLIGIPCMDYCHTDFLRALLSLEVSGEVQYAFAQSSLIYDARNKLADMAIDGGFERVLWLDSDMTFDPSTFRRFHEHLDQGREIVTGLYFTRKPPMRPVIYKDLRAERNGKFVNGIAENFDDYPRDDIFTVKGCGFGAVMTSTDLLRRIRDELGAPFAPATGFGEDLSFCLRCEHLGVPIWCDSSIKCGHVGLAVYSEENYRALLGHNDL